MNEEKNKIQTFEDLNCWKEAHKFLLEIYKTTEKFPKTEQFSLTSQMRRAGVSITSNIAEGFSRGTYNDKIHFYNMAQGSVTELQNQLILAKDLGYIAGEKYENLREHSILVHKLITGFIKGARRIRDHS